MQSRVRSNTALIVIINECCEIRREIFKLHIVQWVWGPHFSFVCCRVVAQRAVAEETGVLKLAELSIILQWDQTHFEFVFEYSNFLWNVFSLSVILITLEFKVHIFWEGHKILRNLRRLFDWHYLEQTYRGDFAKFYALLRTYELHLHEDEFHTHWKMLTYLLMLPINLHWKMLSQQWKEIKKYT